VNRQIGVGDHKYATPYEQVTPYAHPYFIRMGH